MMVQSSRFHFYHLSLRPLRLGGRTAIVQKSRFCVFWIILSKLHRVLYSGRRNAAFALISEQVTIYQKRIFSMPVNSHYLADDSRYSTMPCHHSGKSGLKLPVISLGLWHNS